MWRKFMFLAVCWLLPVCCIAGKADTQTRQQVKELYETIDGCIAETCKLCTKNPTTPAMIELLKRNDAVCKNVITTSDAPEDFKKAIYAYADGARYSIAIIVLRNVHGEQYSPEEVKQLKKWEQQAKVVDQLATKYGYKSKHASVEK